MRRAASLCTIVFSVLAMVSILFPAQPVRAQQLYASIRGTVTDPSGGALAGATITVTNEATGVARQAMSGPDGTYNFQQLAIGDYDLKVEKSGFEAFVARKIHLDVNDNYVEPVQMTLGAVTQQVTVEANQVQVETTTTQLGAVIQGEQIVDLPLIGRDWIQLQALQPGVQGGSDRFGASTSSAPDYSTNGGESQFNVFLIDGTDTNDLDLNTGTIIPSEDAIAEFRMVTSTMNPEYARSSGAILNAVIKSGTNSFHGDAFDYYRDTFLDSAPYGAAGVSPYHENQFGGTIGGPVIKNHTFAFFSYQGVRENNPQTNNGVPPSGVEVTPVFAPGQATGTAAFSDLSTSTSTSPFPLVGDNGTTYAAGTPYSVIFSNGKIPTADINPISAKFIQMVPALANPNITIAGTPEYSFASTRSYSDNQYLYRVDQHIGDKDWIWGTWFNEKAAVLEPVPFQGATLPGFGESDGESYKFLTAAWSHVINSHMTNELRVGYNRFNYQAVFPQTPQLPSSLGFAITPQSPGGAGLPYVNVTGLFDLGFSEYGPQPRIDQVYQANDNFAVILGRHTLKLGFDMRRWEVLNPSLSTNSGAFFFNSVGAYSTGDPGADFLLGIPAYYEQASGGLENARTRQYYSYAQDQFQFKPNLTLIFGLGWTIDTPILNIAYNGHGQLAFRPGVQSTVFPNAPVGVVYEGDPGVDAAGPTQYLNLGPRLGIAYSPDWGWLTGGAGRTSIRAGFGIYYDKSETEQAGQVGFGVPPFAITTVNGVTQPGTPASGVNPGFANPFKDIATGATVANPYPFSGYPSNVNFANPNLALEPIYTPCCASVAPDTKDPRVTNYNLTVQRQVGAATVVTVGYVGSESRFLSYGMPLNIVTGLSGVNTVNKYDLGVYGPIDQIISGGDGNYNAFQASVDKRLAHGLEFLVSYTYSHALDDTSGFENSSFGEYGGQTGGYGGSIRSSNPYCFPKCDYGPSVFDARHRLVISYVYQFPGLHNQGWMIDRLTNGWTITGITSFQTGFPLDIADLSDPSGGCDLAGDFTCWDGPNQVAPVHYLNPRKTGEWFDPSAFAPVNCPPSSDGGCPSAGISPTTVAAYGNAPRDPIRGPGINNWDFVLFKNTAINESMKVQLRMEAYNVFNHAQFNPNGVSTDVFARNFGSIGSALAPRLMQIAAKFIF